MQLSLLYIALLCLDVNGQVAAGVSTSGSAHKAPGRVGDSPLPGCGYYADSDVCIFNNNTIKFHFCN